MATATVVSLRTYLTYPEDSQATRERRFGSRNFGSSEHLSDECHISLTKSVTRSGVPHPASTIEPDIEDDLRDVALEMPNVTGVDRAEHSETRLSFAWSSSLLAGRLR